MLEADFQFDSGSRCVEVLGGAVRVTLRSEVFQRRLPDTPNVHVSVRSHIVYHLKIIMASRRTAERTGLSGFYISLDTVGDFGLQSQKMFLSMNGFVGQDI